MKFRFLTFFLSLFVLICNAQAQKNWIKVTNNKTEDFHASYSPDGGKIIFDSEQNGHNEIYVYNISTKKTVQLTNGTDKSDHPSWFADGKHVLFATWDNGEPKLCKLNIDNVSIEILAESGYGLAAAKGNKIAYLTNKSGNYDISIMDNDGKNQTRLTKNDGDDVGISWASDGKKIAYMSKIKDVFQICTINSDGSDYRQLTFEATDQEGPSWNPKGTEIACSYNLNGIGKLSIIDTLGNGIALIDFPMTHINIDWSPDGKSIICSNGNDTKEELALVTLDNRQIEFLTYNTYRDTHPKWSPDSKSIVFASEMDGELEIYLKRIEN